MVAFPQCDGFRYFQDVQESGIHRAGQGMVSESPQRRIIRIQAQKEKE